MKHLLDETFHINIEEELRPFKWNTQSVATFIQVVKLHWEDLCCTMKKKKFVWEIISNDMKSQGYDVSPIDSDKKFRNIKARYYLALESKLLKKKKAVRIEYFDELDNLLRGQPKTLAKLEQRQKEIILEASQKQAINEFSSGQSPSSDCSEETLGCSQNEWSADALGNFLCLLKEFKDCYVDPTDSNLSTETIWNVVSSHMQLKGYSFNASACRDQWQYVVNKFNLCKNSSLQHSWDYFGMVEDVILNVPIPITGTKRKSSTHIGRMEKRCKLEPSLETNLPSTSIKVEKLDHPFEEDETLSSTKFSQLSRDISLFYEKLAVWKQLNKLESNIDNKLEKLLKDSDSLDQLASDASILEKKLAKKLGRVAQPDDNITIVIPNNGNAGEIL